MWVREAIDRGEILGPSLYVSGPFIQHEAYPGTEAFRWGVSGSADARAKVKKLAVAGVDVIKLIDQDQMTMEELRAVVEEAHRNDLPVIAHAHRPEEIRRGLAVGVDGFEHTGLGTAPEYPEDIVEALAARAHTVFWTPTLTPLLLFEDTVNFPERLDQEDWTVGLPAPIVDDIRRSLRPVDQLDYYRFVPRRRPTLQRKIDQLRQAGVTLMIGTDSGVPLTFHSDSTWRELDYWVRIFGFEPMAAIRAATYWPAVSLGKIDEVGTVSEGKFADIIAVEGDVLTHIDLLQDVALVIRHGERIR